MRSLTAAQERDGLRCEPLSAPGEAELVGRRRPHGDAIEVDTHRSREARAHGVAHGRDPGLLSDEHAVGVHKLPACPAHDLVGSLKQADGRRVQPLRIARWKELADVAEPGRA